MKKDTSIINDFFKLKSFAIIGVSSKKKKFGNSIMKELLARGFKLFPIHKVALVVDSVPCYPDIHNLPEKPEGVILVIPPAETEKVVKEIAAEGIKHVWMQQGAESKAAIDYCVSHGIKVVSNECVLMFLNRPGFPHNIHHWIWGLGN